MKSHETNPDDVIVRVASWIVLIFNQVGSDRR